MSKEVVTISQCLGNTQVIHVGTAQEIEESGLLGIVPAVAALLKEPCLSIITLPLTRAYHPSTHRLVCSALGKQTNPDPRSGCGVITNEKDSAVWHHHGFVYKLCCILGPSSRPSGDTNASEWNVELQTAAKSKGLAPDMNVTIPSKEAPVCAQCASAVAKLDLCSCETVYFCNGTCASGYEAKRHALECEYLRVGQTHADSKFPHLSSLEVAHLFQKLVFDTVTTFDSNHGLRPYMDMLRVLSRDQSANWTSAEKDVGVAIVLAGLTSAFEYRPSTPISGAVFTLIHRSALLTNRVIHRRIRDHVGFRSPSLLGYILSFLNSTTALRAVVLTRKNVKCSTRRANDYFRSTKRPRI
jgi:hypothetical protein